MWWAKVRLLAPTWFAGGTGFLRRTLRYQELLEKGQNERAELQPYERLAKYWHQLAGRRVPNYTAFLARIAQRRRRQLRSVLDLACGAGTVTEKLASVATEVIGLDASEAMLAQAIARCSALPNVKFVRSDFRDFHLGRQFDAVVCASDSLNYVRDADELGKVFRCVSAHLAADGLFLFDTSTERGMRMLSGYYRHATIDGERFAIAFNYDPESRKERSVVHLSGAVEVHQRIPIDPKDVEAAAKAGGLAVDDYFSFASISGRWYTGLRCFFILRRAL